MVFVLGRLVSYVKKLNRMSGGGSYLCEPTEPYTRWKGLLNRGDIWQYVVTYLYISGLCTVMFQCLHRMSAFIITRGDKTCNAAVIWLFGKLLFGYLLLFSYNIKALIEFANFSRKKTCVLEPQKYVSPTGQWWKLATAKNFT